MQILLKSSASEKWFEKGTKRKVDLKELLYMNDGIFNVH